MEKMNFKWINRPSLWVGFWAMLMFGQMVFAQAPTTWTHPGGNNNKADLDYVKSKIAAGEQPWTTRYAQIVAIATPGVATVPADENGMKAEGRKAYANALAWYYSGNVTYANNAIAILNNWGNNFTGFGAPGGQNLLVGGWIGALLGPAAEIMRGYAGWTPAQILVVQNMFRTRFYPVLNQMSTWNGNVDLTQIDAMLNIAVFNEDATLFNSAISRLRLRNPAYFYLSTDPAASRNYATITSQSWNAANWVNGLTQETCRTGGNYNGNGNDNGHHAQYALASAIHAAEVAWNQGVDIYGENETRYIAALELLSTQLYTGSMQNTCADNVAATEFYSTFEMGYNHYANRLGRTLTNTRTFITSRIRVNSASDWNIFYETLTHNLDGFVPGPSCSRPALGIDRSICGRANITLNTSISGVGKTFTWFRNNASITGQNGTALTITQGGTYRVDVDSAGCKTTDEVVVSNALAVDLGADKDLCNPVQYTLDAGNATNVVSYAWNTGATSQTITVSNPGTYTVTVSATNCASVTDAVVVTSKLLSVKSDTLCAAGIANLSVLTTGSYAWYDVATGGTNLGTGVSFSPSITASRTYYVQDLGGMVGTLGKTNVGAGATWTIGTADFGAVDKYNLLTVTQAVNLNSLAVYVVAGGANVTINIKQGAITIHTRTVTNVPAGRQVIPLNFALTPGNYIIDAVGTTANLTFEASGATFPYSYPGYLSFANNSSWQSTWYGLFYDWNITAGNVCARTPVAAVVNPSSPKCSSYALGTIAGANSLCNGATSSFSVRTVSGVNMYTWSVPAGWVINSGQGTNLVSITANSVSGIVRVVPVGNSGTGTGSNLTVNITGNVSPTVSIAASRTSVCSGSTVTFTATGANSGSAPVYAWFRNGIVTPTGATFTYSPSNGDAITARVTSGGTIPTCLSTTTAASTVVNLVVNGNVSPTVAIAASQTSVCAGSTVTFTATGVNAGSAPVYAWFRNGIATSTGATFTYSPANGDAITARLTAGGTIPTCLSTTTAASAAVNLVVTGNVNPTVAIAASQTSVCAGSAVTLTATGANAGTTPVYAWFRNGIATSTGRTFTYSPANGDAITARVTTGGTLPTCLANTSATSTAINLTVNPLFNATVAVVPSANPICAGTNVTFTATPTNGGTTPTYRWTVNNALQAGTANTFTYVPANGDVVKAVVQVGGTGNACIANTSATSTGVTINVNGTIPASVSVSASTLTYCAGNTANITASATGTGSAPVYRWYVNNVAQATATNTFSFVPSNSDVVKVVMTPGGNGLTCVTGGTSTSNGLSFVVNQNVMPSVSIVSSGATICAGNSVAFSATGVNLGSNPTISWRVNGNSQASGATFAYQPANGDVIQVNATAGGTLPTCLATTSANSNSISITVNPSLTASVSVNASATSICSGTGISLTATGVNVGLNATYTWIKNGTVFSTGNTLTDVPSYGDAYAVMVTVGTSSACMTNTTAVSNVIIPSVSICPLPNPGSIAGPNFVATGTNNVVYTVPYVTGDSYLWTVPSGATIISGQGTNSITVSFGNTVATGDITLAQTNANGTTTVSKSVTTGNVPGAVTISGPTTVDPNQTSIVYSVTSVAGTSYQWTVPAGMTIISGQGTNSIVVNVGTSVSGAVELTQTNAFGSTITSVTVTTSIPTDLMDEALLGEINLYPNPTSATFQISLGRIASEVTVEVTDDHGVLILTTNQGNDLGGNLQAGHYIVTIKTNNGVKRFPLVKVD